MGELRRCHSEYSETYDSRIEDVVNNYSGFKYVDESKMVSEYPGLWNVIAAKWLLQSYHLLGALPQPVIDHLHVALLLFQLLLQLGDLSFQTTLLIRQG